jgi:hypothetical protein
VTAVVAGVTEAVAATGAAAVVAAVEVAVAEEAKQPHRLW